MMDKAPLAADCKVRALRSPTAETNNNVNNRQYFYSGGRDNRGVRYPWKLDRLGRTRSDVQREFAVGSVIQ